MMFFANLKKKLPSYISFNGQDICGPKIISDYFNQFFVNIGSEISKSMPNCNDDYAKFLTTQCTNSLLFIPYTNCRNC